MLMQMRFMMQSTTWFVNPSLMMERITRTEFQQGQNNEIQQVMEMDRAKEMAHPLTEQSRPEILHRSQEHLH